MKELKEFSSEEEYVPRSIQYIVVHCSATRANIPFTEEQLLKCHLQRGFKCIGYHFISPGRRTSSLPSGIRAGCACARL